MWTLLRASMRGRLGRLGSIGLAVGLGVAFLTGTLALGDTARANFDDLFTQAYGRTDVVVRSATTLDTDVEAAQGLVPVALAEQLRALDGVRTVEPQIEGFGQLTGADGEKLGGQGPPTLAGSWVEDTELSPWKVVEGRAPEGPDEVVINRGAAEDGGLGVGDVTTVATPEPVTVTVVGIATFGGADGLGPTTWTAFTFAGAERHVTGRPGQASSLLVAGKDGVDAAALRAEIAARLPAGVEAITGGELVADANETLDEDFLGFLRGLLTAFAAVALLVATFSIHNTFAIVVAQRTRETALLRAVGASRRQVLGSVLAEGALVGVAASAAGVVAGVGFAGLLKGLFDAFGFALPAGGLTLGRALLVAPAVGVVVTLLAGLTPALRASRVAPLEAMRASATDGGRASRARLAVGAVLVAGGIGLAVAGAGSHSLALAGLGAVALTTGTVVLGPGAVPPVAAALGGVLGRLRGVTGALAARNAVRSPRRTAGTASALLVGVGVVTVFTVVAGSLRASIDDRVAEVVSADLLISASGFGGGGLSPGLADALDGVPEVDGAVGVATGPVSIEGRTSQASVADPADLAGHLTVDVGDGFAVSDTVADDRGWAVGDTVAVTFPDGATETLTIGAVYETADPIVNGYLVPRQVWDRHAVQTVDNQVLIRLADGVSVEDGRGAVEAVAAPFAPPDVQTRAEFVEDVTANVNAMLGLVYAMLALAIVIALMGIANTLSLSIHERVRELGLLRTVGQTRRQLRSMVRWESVVIAVLGTAGGVALGLFLGWALIGAASGSGTVRFAAPVGLLVPVAVVGALAGVLAAIRPARRAARLPVLEAVATT